MMPAGTASASAMIWVMMISSIVTGRRWPIIVAMYSRVR